MIHGSDGQQYDSPLDVALGMPLKRPEKGTDALKPEEPSTPSPLVIDRSKDVPLAASALHKDGQFYGIAVDKDAPITDLGVKGWSPWHGVYKHEQSEFEHMKNLKAQGMSDQDAYHEAHDKIATPIETAYVRGIAAQNGKDPDKFLDDYKQYWRDVAGNASIGPFDRHPDAHTTTFGLDESELPPEAKQFLKGKVQEQQQHSKEFFQHLVEPFAEIGHAIVGDEDRWSNLGKGLVDIATPKLETSIFGGLLAATADKEMFKKALDMAKAGKPADEIWVHTGWSVGADSRAKFEIPDKGSKILTDNLKPLFPGSLNENYKVPEEGLKISDVFKHDALFDAYPHLKDINVKPVSGWDALKGVRGAFDNKTNTLYLGASNPEQMKSVILHELQHGVQEKEGFARGGNSGEFYPKEIKDLESEFYKNKTDWTSKVKAAKGIDSKELYKMQRAVLEETDPRIDKGYYKQLYEEHYKPLVDKAKSLGIYNDLSNLNKSEAYIQVAKDRAMEEYKGLAGETEARNVQTRRDFSDLDRIFNTPERTEDVPRSEQNVKYSGSRGDISELNDPVAWKPGYDAKLRDLIEQGLSVRAIAKELGVSKSYVSKIMTKQDLDSKNAFGGPNTGSFGIGGRGTGKYRDKNPGPLLDPLLERLKQNH